MLLSFRMGEELGFTYIFNEFSLALSYYAMLMVKDRQRAEDVVQESFLELWTERERFHEIITIKSWLYQSVYKRCKNGLRDPGNDEQKLTDKKGEDISDPDDQANIIRAELWSRILRPD